MLPSVQQFKINANWMRGKLYFMQEKAGVLDELQKAFIQRMSEDALHER